jgi:CheY-like chemotaxis protein
VKSVDSEESTASARHRLLLVVEDDPAIRELMVHAVMEEPGVHVMLAADGAEALAAFEKVRPHLVLLDLQLPGIDGLEVARRLKAAPETASVPIVGFSAGSNAAAAREAGCDGFVAKPFDIDEVMTLIRNRLSGEPPG